MTYASLQNLVDRFGENELIQLTDRERLGEVNQAVIERALTDADAQINGYLSVRYTLPLAAPLPIELERIACDLARYALYEDRMIEIVEKRYQAAIALLRDVAAGRAKLGVIDSSSMQSSNNGAQMTSTSPAFKRGDSQGFI